MIDYHKACKDLHYVNGHLQAWWLLFNMSKIVNIYVAVQ